MRKKLAVICTSLMLASFSAVGIGLLVGNAEEVSFGTVQLQEVYDLNATFNVPQAQVIQDGEVYQAESKIVFPDASSYESDSFVLTQEGVYTIIYYCKIGGEYYQKEESFEVKSSSESLFTIKNGSVKIGESDISHELCGAQIDGSLGLEVTYNRVIDLSESTKNDMFLEIVATAHEEQKPDFSEFYITLTDIYDATNTVQIKVHCAKTNSYQLSYSKAKACDKNWIGGAPVSAIIGGTVLKHSFGSWDFTADNTIKLFWDNDDLSIYTYNSAGVKTEMADFNEESYITKIWDGFTTGEVQLSISIGDVTGMPRYVIKSINGLAFENDYPTDNIAPSIRVDLPDGDLPDAQVGKEFKLFSSVVTDNLAVNELSTKVYYNYASGNYVELAVIDGAFTPTRKGDYTIVYFAKDSQGNTDEKIVTITAYETLDPLVVMFDGKEVENRQAGEYFAMQNVAVTGGSGGYITNFYLRSDGNEKEINHDDIQLITPGTYTIVCVVRDYIGNVVECEYDIIVSAQSSLFMDSSFHLPKAFVSDQAFALPMPISYDYSTGSMVAVTPVVSATVDGNAVAVSQDGVFTPSISSEKGIANIKYTYSKGDLLGEYIYSVPVVNVKDADGLAMERFFVGDAFTSSANVSCIQFATTTSNSELSFVKSLQAKSFALEFITDATIMNTSCIDFIFTDKLDRNISVVVRMYPNGTMSVNGSKAKAVSSSVDEENQLYTIAYDNENFSFSDRNGSNFGIVSTTASGEEFKGFTSDEIYLTICMGEVRSSVNFSISKLNGQVITRATRDVIAPQVFFHSELGGMKSVGDKVTVYVAQAYDVLSTVNSVSVTVRNTTTGNYVKSDDGVLLNNVDGTKTYEITISEFGSYVIQVAAKDSANRVTTATKTMFVGDTIKPTIIVEGNISRTANVNETIILPNMNVKDNMSESDKIVSYIVVFDPNGLAKICVGGFIPMIAGTYVVRYVAMDENNQIATVEYSIVVS